MSLRKDFAAIDGLLAKKSTELPRARLVVHGADELTRAEMFKLTKWLRNVSYDLEDNLGYLSKRFTARLMK